MFSNLCPSKISLSYLNKKFDWFLKGVTIAAVLTCCELNDNNKSS